MDSRIVWLILGMSLVTYLPRVLPLLLFKNFQLPELVLRWLNYIPTAILAALLFPNILIKENQLALSWNNEYLLAAIPSFIIAIITRSLVWTVLVGVLSVYILRNIVF